MKRKQSEPEVTVCISESSGDEGEGYVQQHQPGKNRVAETDPLGPGDFKWQWIEETWPRATRSSTLQTRAQVESKSLQEISLMHKMHVNQKKLEKTMQSQLKKDEIPPTLKFRAAKDNGQNHLHAARWLRLPFCEPKDYFTWYR